MSIRKKIKRKLEQISKKSTVPIQRKYETHGTNPRPLGNPPKNPRC